MEQTQDRLSGGATAFFRTNAGASQLSDELARKSFKVIMNPREEVIPVRDLSPFDEETIYQRTFGVNTLQVLMREGENHGKHQGS